MESRLDLQKLIREGAEVASKMIREPKKRYVLVFYTGGTIGMTESDQGE